jgi:transposase
MFAALDAADGQVTGKRTKNHKAQDYAGFLKVPDRKAPKGKVPHIVADNNSSHKAPAVKGYPEKKGGYFIPAYSSRLNMIGRRFAWTTNKRTRRESRSSLKELEEAIVDYIISWNESGRRFS